MHTTPRLVLLVLVILGFASSAGAAGVQAGIAVADITPPVGGHVLGYGSALTTDGVNYPITARVLVLESGGRSVALVTWDLCIANSTWLHERVREIGIDQLFLLNTHTHAGPNLDEADFPSKDQSLRGAIEQKVFTAIKQARENLFPATFMAGEGSIQLGYNRLVRGADNVAVTHFENAQRIPYGPVDPTVGVLRITDAQGAVRAVLVNYACHAVVLGPPNRKLSADFPGAMRTEVEAKLGTGAVCFFLQGAAGDINPLMLARSGDVATDLPVVDEMGKALAGEVLSVLARLKAESGKSEKLSLLTKTFEVEDRWTPSTSIRVSVTTMLLNEDIGILVMPGEPFHQYQLDWRRKAGVPHAFFLGYCWAAGDPWAGYMPDIESAARGGFGASDATNVAVGTGERLLSEGLAQLYTLQGRLLPKPQRHLKQ